MSQIMLKKLKTPISIPLVRIPLFLAHLSQMLIGELIVYSWSGVRPSFVVVRRRSQCSKIFFSETALPIKAKFYVEPPWVGGTIFCSRHLGHMTKMAATPIYGKNHSKIQMWTLKNCNHVISKSITARSFKLGQLIENDE